MAAAPCRSPPGCAVGAALWGNCNWGRGDVNINVNQYNNFTRNVNTANIASQRTQIQNTRVANNNGAWQHDPAHRQGVQYRDNATQQRFNKTGAPNPQSREAFRGRAEQGRQDIAGGNVQGLDAARGRAGGSGAGQQRAEGAGRARAGELARVELARARIAAGRSSWRRIARPEPAGRRGGGENRGASAFQGVGSGREVSAASNRGAQSRQSFGASGGAAAEAGPRAVAARRAEVEAGPGRRPGAVMRAHVEENAMRSTRVQRWLGATRLAAVVLLVAAWTAGAWAAATRTFETPEQAVESLIAAIRKGDNKEILAILGPQAKTLVSSGDPVADRALGERFVRAYDASHGLRRAAARSC